MNRHTMWTAVFFGGLWGFGEATIGFLLHLASRVSFMPGLAGFVMFPLGFFFLMSTYARTGSPSAAGITTLAAAGIKAASVLHPAVPALFVVNPVLSILSEGLAVSLCFHLAGSLLAPPAGSTARTAALAVAMSVGWRLVFVGLVAALPVQKGILMKGATALAGFLIVDSAVNALLVAAVVETDAANRIWSRLSLPAETPRLSAAAVVAAVGSQLLLGGLG